MSHPLEVPVGSSMSWCSCSVQLSVPRGDISPSLSNPCEAYGDTYDCKLDGYVEAMPVFQHSESFIEKKIGKPALEVRQWPGRRPVHG